MTTATTNTTVSMASTTAFNAWVYEIMTNFVTNCGLTQTADTGQMSTLPTAPSYAGSFTANTSVGYYICAFNDTLQSTAPIYIRFDFGAGSTTTTMPMFWVTVGSSTNGAGTITGTATSKAACCSNVAISSTSTNYVSYYCYNATQGFLGCCFKTSGTGTVNVSIGGFLLFRTVNSSGASTGAGCLLLGNEIGATVGTSSSVGTAQVLSFTLGALQTLAGSTGWGGVPFYGVGQTTIKGSNGQIFPVYQFAPTSSAAGYGISNAAALGVITEIATGATITATVLGSTSLTYIGIGGVAGVGASMTQATYNLNTMTCLMLWQ